MLLSARLIACALIFAGVAPARADVDASQVPEEFVKLSKMIREEKSRDRRLSLLRDLQTLSKKRKSEVPDDVPEADLPKTVVLYELEMFLSSLSPEKLTPASCGTTVHSITTWSNPIGEGEMNPTGRFVLEIVQAVCRE